MLENSPKPCHTMPSVQPKVFRYLEKIYIEIFFKSGTIMLTSYDRCKNHEYESRKDSKEGTSQYEVIYEGVHGNEKTCGWHAVGAGSYMLCTSKIESKELMKKFSVDGYFLIDDVLAFSEAISKKILGYLEVKYGCCIYQDSRVISKQKTKPLTPLIPSKPFEDENHEQIQKIIEQLQENLSEHYFNAAEETFFLKENNHSEEEEYRIIWKTSNTANKSIIIDCPEAVQFCTKIT